MTKTVIAVIVVIYISCMTITAQVSAQKDGLPKNPATPVSGISSVVEEYRIGPQDLLDVSVWDYPQFDLKVVIRPDKKIEVKLLSDVQAAGLSTKQVEKLIADGLKSTEIVTNAHVTVIVLEIHSQTVTVMGSGVRSTGEYPIGGPVRVLDLLAKAGLNEFAKKNEIIIVRDEGNKRFTKYPFDYDSFVKGNYSQNILLRSGDTVIVP